MKNILTAEEFMLDTLESMDQQEVERAMIEFAKMHVEAALKAAAENAEVNIPDYGDYEVDEESILNAYPLENIK